MWDFYLKTIPQRYRCGLFPHVYSSQWCVKRIILVFSHAAILAALRCFKYTQQCFELNGKCRHANIRAQTMLTCWRLAVMMWKQTTPHGLNASNRGIEAGCFAVLLHHSKELRDHLTQGLVTSRRRHGFEICHSIQRCTLCLNVFIIGALVNKITITKTIIQLVFCLIMFFWGGFNPSIQMDYQRFGQHMSPFWLYETLQNSAPFSTQFLHGYQLKYYWAAISSWFSVFSCYH